MLPNLFVLLPSLTPSIGLSWVFVVSMAVQRRRFIAFQYWKKNIPEREEVSLFLCVSIPFVWNISIRLVSWSFFVELLSAQESSNAFTTIHTFGSIEDRKKIDGILLHVSTQQTARHRDGDLRFFHVEASGSNLELNLTATQNSWIELCCKTEMRFDCCSRYILFIIRIFLFITQNKEYQSQNFN